MKQTIQTHIVASTPRPKVKAEKAMEQIKHSLRERSLARDPAPRRDGLGRRLLHRGDARPRGRLRAARPERLSTVIMLEYSIV